MANLSLKSRSSSGGTPIRGVQMFDRNTPDDYTYKGQRFLRQGVLETDTNQFDTSIWTKADILPNVQTDISGLSISTLDATGGLQKQDNTLIAPFNTTGMTSSDGINWTVKVNMGGAKTRMYEITSGANAGRLVYGVTDSASGLVRWSDDDFDTSNTSTTGVGAIIEDMVAGGNRVVAGNNNIWRYSTNDALSSWAACTGTLFNLTGASDEFAYGGGVWLCSVTVGTNSRRLTRSTDGAAWVLDPDASLFGTSNHLSGTLFYDPSVGLFKKIGEVATNTFNMWTSPDGVAWTDAGEVTMPIGVAPRFVTANANSGVIVGYSDSTTNEVPLVSRDGGLTWELLNFFGGDGSVMTGIIPFGAGFCAYGNETTQTYNYGLYAGMYDVMPDGDDWQDRQSEMTFVRIS